jgi:general secretion pathway protein K
MYDKIYKLKKLPLMDQKGGVAFILVIWIIVMLLVIAGEFSSTMKTELKITKNFKEEEEAYQMALAGFEQARMEILTMTDGDYVYFDDDGVLILSREVKEDDDEKKVTFEKNVDFSDGKFTYNIIDEKSKMNLNTASVQQIRYILASTGVETSEANVVVDSIIDWRDANDLHMAKGAEEDYYQSLEEPYSSKDSKFNAVEELLLVRGVTPEIYYGSGAVKGENEYEGIKDYFTVWSSNDVNLSTSSNYVLEAVFGARTAGNIISEREAGYIPNTLPGGIVTSRFFTIVSTGYNRDSSIKRSIKVTTQRTKKGLETLYWNDNYTG